MPFHWQRPGRGKEKAGGFSHIFMKNKGKRKQGKLLFTGKGAQKLNFLLHSALGVLQAASSPQEKHLQRTSPWLLPAGAGDVFYGSELAGKLSPTDDSGCRCWGTFISGITMKWGFILQHWNTQGKSIRAATGWGQQAAQWGAQGTLIYTNSLPQANTPGVALKWSLHSSCATKTSNLWMTLN